MIKGTEKTIYDIDFTIYESGDIQGTVKGKYSGSPRNYLALLNGSIRGGNLWLYAAEDKIALADMLADFRYMTAICP